MVTPAGYLRAQDLPVDNLSAYPSTYNFIGIKGLDTGTPTLFRGTLPTGGGPIAVLDEGSQLTANATSFNFTGAGVTVSNTGGIVTVNIPGGGLGTVTSVGLTAPSIFTVSGSPVTDAGTLGFSLNSQAQRLFLASPTGASGVPVFRAIDNVDLPSTLDANARVAVSKGGTLAGTRRKINFIEGSGVTITVADDSANEEVDVTISSTGGGGGGGLSSIPVSDEGSAVGNATSFNFTGNVVAQVSSGVATINVPTAGDMSRSIYDSNNNGIVDVAESIDGNPGAGQYYGTPIGGTTKGFYVLRNSRELLTSSYVLNCDPTGNDTTGDGSINNPFRQPQRAIDEVATKDLGLISPVVKLAAGTYDKFVFKSLVGSGECIIEGNTANPASVIITPTSGTGDCISADAYNGVYLLRGFHITNSGGNGIYIRTQGMFKYEFLNFGYCSSVHAAIEGNSIAQLVNSYTISGGAGYHFYSLGGARFFCNHPPHPPGGKIITLTGTPNFSGSFAIASNAGIINCGNFWVSFVGSATGQRYTASANGVINTSTSGANYFPGNIDGTIDVNGGRYL